MIIYCSLHHEAENQKRKRDAEEIGDAMKSLENRTMDSKREMDILAALDEMKSMKVCACLILYCLTVSLDMFPTNMMTL